MNDTKILPDKNLYWTAILETVGDEDIVKDMLQKMHVSFKTGREYKKDICKVYSEYYEKDNLKETNKICDMAYDTICESIERNLKEYGYSFKIKRGLLYVYKDTLKIQLKLGVR